MLSFEQSICEKKKKETVRAGGPKARRKRESYRVSERERGKGGKVKRISGKSKGKKRIEITQFQ